MIEAHIITLPKSKYSMDLAERCISNLKDKLNIDGKLFNGTDRYSVWQKYIDSNLNLKIHKFGIGMLDSEIGTFFSHLNLWQKCLDNSKKFLILENDSFFTKNVDIEALLNFNGDLLNLGFPSWMDDEDNLPVDEYKKRIGLEWLDKPNGILKRDYESCLYGAHTYLLNPSGAKKLIDNLQNGIEPADMYLNTNNIEIYDLLPHPAEARNGKSFIQRHTEKIVWDY